MATSQQLPTTQVTIAHSVYEQNKLVRRLRAMGYQILSQTVWDSTYIEIYYSTPVYH